MKTKTQLQGRLGKALLQGNPLNAYVEESPVIPSSEMPMILTLDQLRPNPDNPRIGKNPRYDEIKDSIRQRGLDSVPKVTQSPGSQIYIFSDGGNTRYQILSELWQETQDQRFYRLHVLFKPWPGRRQCLIGHMAENVARGGLTFLEKAQGVNTLRGLYEEEQGKKLSLRALAQHINADGLPISFSHISKMEDTLANLAPYMPRSLEAGLGRHQIEALLSLRSTLKKLAPELPELIDCFNKTCERIDTQDYFMYDAFVDELIGLLLRDCPSLKFDYDRWLFELKVNKGKPISPEGNPGADDVLDSGVTASAQCEVNEPVSPTPHHSAPALESADKATAPLDADSPVLSEQLSPRECHDNKADAGTAHDNANKGVSTSEGAQPKPVESVSLSCADIWPLLTHQADIEHLQVQAYRTLFELSNQLDLSTSFMASSGVHSPGFITAPDNSALSLIMSAFSNGDEQLDDVSAALKHLLTGGTQADNQPVLNDAQFLLWMKLMYTLRCLFAQQRNVEPGIADDDEEFDYPPSSHITPEHILNGGDKHGNPASSGR
ncbi:ParB family protein [Providencia rettgeri]|uniref:Integrating conjugative element, PFGI_1 class, ParB family protein n=1 Tax=Providencia rettgeri TaxID=587 RepID=A0A9N8D2H4_PRORE|nr:ParB family protein [Providencia rettgeri]CAB5649599.1 integrating conjugative element, PFGI_1 class, ParB family protein [Providencia rettgeri]CAB5688589.1 integrating conjugative element, PFGI_1 class, ParB family protein [Providencia rettgeri]CAC9189520.1 integrating conjugative element, PFGI_1 class, ParB family protein [Providencia rettgeri]CAC9223861.1 integrating conjugative element, PFGI_1 class, ParB family protein [Providencia rettgeri]